MHVCGTLCVMKKFHLTDKFCSREEKSGSTYQKFHLRKYFVIALVDSQPNFLKSSTYIEVPLMRVPLERAYKCADSWRI